MQRFGHGASSGDLSCPLTVIRHSVPLILFLRR